MLIVMLRVELNIIGGYMYVDSLLNRNGVVRAVHLQYSKTNEGREAVLYVIQ